ncbi:MULTISPECIES: GPO family capsid scaffolding protein [unclassified Vibrio]|uniref:GPO family capsid scaffolding protein n=1 Tax=unclassified Vibrio TaxID=2614977 RepID=UPI001360C51B|nr:MULTISPECIES: GPO family capsid scaffolding protein [unclassified Vibrio]NAW58487.1 hypothetical protein [Vibrio sp. V36_P2S2PM302]NAX24959.1 hypothetical protein [Vibrio sp. V38_P2S17PM301]NAX32559.1 hypothetical protein [Vibrio sp. V37_P2S8PM304]
MGLETGFKVIGTAGDTVDGRVIDEKWLKQLVKNYDVNKYTAVINLNHWNPKFYGTFGKVLALKLGKNDEGKVNVSANIEPNQKLIAMGKEEVLFTSMEIDPDFQKSGEAYLVGLAVTPKPASVGTEQIAFSSDDSSAFKTTDFIQFDFSELQAPGKTEDSKFMARLRNLFQQYTPEESEEETPMSGVDKKQVEELTAQVSSLTQQMSQMFGQSDASKAQDQTLTGDASKLMETLAPQLEKFGITLSLDQPKTDSERIDELSERLNQFMAKLDSQEPGDDKNKGQSDNANLVALQEQLNTINNTLLLAINGEHPGTPAGVQTTTDSDDELV